MAQQTTIVINMSTLEERVYSMGAALAVTAAWADEHKRRNTWDIPELAKGVRYGFSTVFMGDWSAQLYEGEERVRAVRRLTRLDRTSTEAVEALATVKAKHEAERLAAQAEWDNLTNRTVATAHAA